MDLPDVSWRRRLHPHRRLRSRHHRPHCRRPRSCHCPTHRNYRCGGPNCDVPGRISRSCQTSLQSRIFSPPIKTLAPKLARSAPKQVKGLRGKSKTVDWGCDMHPPDPEMRSPATRQSDRANSQSSTFHTREVIHHSRDGQPLAAQIRKVRSLWFLSIDAARTVATLAFGGLPR